jgi:hypothetical protein
MPNSSGTWKTGERVLEPARYECLNCKVLGNNTNYDLEAGKLFPYCTVCNLKDNTYKIVPSKKR